MAPIYTPWGFTQFISWNIHIRGNHQRSVPMSGIRSSHTGNTTQQCHPPSLPSPSPLLHALLSHFFSSPFSFFLLFCSVLDTFLPLLFLPGLPSRNTARVSAAILSQAHPHVSFTTENVVITLIVHDHAGLLSSHRTLKSTMTFIIFQIQHSFLNPKNWILVNSVRMWALRSSAWQGLSSLSRETWGRWPQKENNNKKWIFQTHFKIVSFFKHNDEN